MNWGFKDMNLNLFLAKKIGGKSGIACFSIAISMIVMIIAIAISDGFKKEIGEKAVGFSGEILFTVPGQEITNDKYPLNYDFSYLEDIKAIKQVKSFDPVVYCPGMFKTDENVQGILFKGVDSLYQLDFFAAHIVEGSLPDFSSKGVSNEILVSRRLGDMLGYKVGDKVVAYFIGENVRARSFVISGMYSIQLEDLDERLVVCDIRHTRRLNGWNEHQASCVEVSLGGSGTANSTKRRENVLNQIFQIIDQKDTPDDQSVVVKEISDVYSHLFDWLALLDLNVLVVLILMIVVAGFNMISGLLIILFEKISMIGLLKSLGMKTRDICAIFIYRGGMIVLKGMVIGNIIAFSLALIQKYGKIITLNPENYFVSEVPISIEPVTMIVLNICSFVLMMLIMIIPSMFISKVSPDKTIKVN